MGSNLVLRFQFVSLLLLTTFVLESLQGLNERRLLSTLFDDYEVLERPVVNDSQALDVEFGLTLQQIIDVDEKYQVINSNIWLNMLWRDYRLTWKPEEFGNITVINVPIKTVWRPDILMYNSADEKFDATFQTNAVIKNTGMVTWVPPGMFKSTCNINIRWFPFDDQQCELKFGSWTYDGSKLNLTLRSKTGDITAFIKNGEWTLLGMPGSLAIDYYECCPGMPFPSITYFIMLRRRKLFYITNFFIPSSMINSLSVASFIMPVDSGEKVGFGMPARLNTRDYADVTWIEIAFVINIRRRALYYTFNLIVPSVILSSIALLSFTLPVESGEKISLGVTILLSLTVFLLLVAEAMPPTSDAIPLIGIYFACTMMMCSLSVIFTVLVLNFHSRRPETHEMPDWVKRGVCQWLAWLLRMKRPGHDLTRRGLIASRTLQLEQRSSRSLLANVLDIDDDIRCIVNGFHETRRSEKYGSDYRMYESSEMELTESTPPSNRCQSAIFAEARHELSAILRELRVITNKLREDQVSDEEASDWKFAAMVIDRLCLYVFVISTMVSTSAILLSAPNIFA